MQTPPKPPRKLFEDIYAFAPNRETLGGTAYFIAKAGGGLLVDCPPWHPETLNFLQAQGGVKTLYITQRAAISNQVAKIQQALGCAIVIQEQEAYLIPEADVTPFRDDWQDGDFRGIWTPGFSPGASCLYYGQWGGCLFTGRHLLPNQKGEILALRTAKTFHWGRQLKGIEKLIEIFENQPLKYLLPAANTGFLRGTGYLTGAYPKLQQAIALSQAQPLVHL
ncbi:MULTISPECIES: hypothetical protein [Cyanophyceae]|uniref:hypothetical protein n=1 Tax=Cyanophyceae TaxID=3028117 RepID=UPI00016DC933|nr:MULTISPECIES: hypothetical protein [Cyanophyceae]ACA99527.1 conserved hypothetical protein [Picosynechococcus sp. PCC 7002]SMH30097.1 hypothetical protein SAMN06272755_0160 [Picosynechococcus sp. OG1]SMQ83826.1 hypothetical protein SAMN06272774_2536 [Synechococcus sp. 7002]